MKKRTHRKPVEVFHFTAMDELLASATQPVPAQRLNGHLEKVKAALASLMRDPEPAAAAWRDLSDAVNILESLRELGDIEDEGDEITKAKDAMGQAGARAMEGGTLRLTGPGMQTLTHLLQDYEEVVTALTERQFVKACRATERRVRAILRGVVRPGDRVIAL